MTRNNKRLVGGEDRKKLIDLLEKSSCYLPEKMLTRFPPKALYEEKAILLSRIGQHDQALTIYAHKLKSAALAEEYSKIFFSFFFFFFLQFFTVFDQSQLLQEALWHRQGPVS